MKNAMNAKRLVMAAMAVTALLCSCSAEPAADQPAPDMFVSEATDMSAAGSTADETSGTVSEMSEAAETSGTMSEVSETSEAADVADVSSRHYDTALFDDIFNENSSQYIVVLCKDGTYKKLTEDEYYDLSMNDYLSELLSEDFYNEYIKDSDYNEADSYEEYKKQVMESLEISEEDLAQQEDYSCIFSTSGNIYSEDGTAGNIADYDIAAKTAFDYILKKTEKDKLQKNVVIDYYVEGDIMNISAYAFSEDEQYDIAEDEYISLSGKDIVVIGDTPVVSDIKSLYISSYDETRAWILSGGANEEYDTVIYDYGGEYGDEKAVLDTAELAEKLPGLEKLYISAYIELSDMSAFSEFEGLKELQIDVSGCKDISMLSGLKTDRLAISGLSCPADVLKTLDVKELCIECRPSEGVLESVYSLENVTELTIERYSDTELYLDGIENMTGLKKLDISIDSGYAIDIAPLAKLNNVEDLSILAYETKNLDKISGMKSVRKLMLHSMEDEDLSFLSDMTGLEELSLMYVNNSFGPSLQYLKNVTYLHIADTTNGADMSRIYQMENLEELTLMGESFTARGIDGLKNLKTLNIMLCSYSDLSGLKKCSRLQNLMIYNCTTPEFDAEDIEGMTGLKTLKFNCSEIDNYECLKTLTGLESMNLFFCDLTSAEQKDIKKALPDCVITLDDDSTVS